MFLCNVLLFSMGLPSTVRLETQLYHSSSHEPAPPDIDARTAAPHHNFACRAFSTACQRDSDQGKFRIVRRQSPPPGWRPTLCPPSEGRSLCLARSVARSNFLLSLAINSGTCSLRAMRRPHPARMEPTLLCALAFSPHYGT